MEVAVARVLVFRLVDTSTRSNCRRASSAIAFTSAREACTRVTRGPPSATQCFISAHIQAHATGAGDEAGPSDNVGGGRAALPTPTLFDVDASKDERETEGETEEEVEEKEEEEKDEEVEAQRQEKVTLADASRHFATREAAVLPPPSTSTRLLARWKEMRREFWREALAVLVDILAAGEETTMGMRYH